jgi:hypothetical protein
VKPREVVPGDGLLHAVPIGALIILLLNDHWWKRAYPSFVTGKLSDVAGLIFFPLLLQALGELARAGAGAAWGPSKRALLIAGFATAVVFGLAKTWAPMNTLLSAGAALVRWPAQLAWALAHHAPVPPLGRSSLVRDPTDLAALPAVLVSLRVGLRRIPGQAEQTGTLPRLTGGAGE